MSFRLITKFLVALGAPAALAGVWAFGIEPGLLYRRTHRLEIASWPSACDGMRVAVLADLHVGSPRNGLDKLARIVEYTHSQKPDLILLAGDYVITGVLGGTVVHPTDIAAGLQALHAPLGVWAVLGNHDWYLDSELVRTAFERVGIPVLENTAKLIESDLCTFWVVGIADYMEGEPDIPAAMAAVNTSHPVVAFTHNPDVFPDVPSRVSLTIAGHTHGGQVYLPLLGRPIVPSRYGQRYAIGHVVEDGRHLFVSTGIGTSILPVRFRVPPEVSVIEIRSGTGASESSQ